MEARGMVGISLALQWLAHYMTVWSRCQRVPGARGGRAAAATGTASTSHTSGAGLGGEGTSGAAGTSMSEVGHTPIC